MVALKKLKSLWIDSSAMSVVEATIILPFVFMTFAALALLSMYLPQRAILQEAAQYAATMLAPERSDVAYRFDDHTMQIYDHWDFQLHNSFADVLMGTYDTNRNFWSRSFSWFKNTEDWQKRVDDIVKHKLANSISFTNAPVSTEVVFQQTLLYSEIVVTVSQEIPLPINLSFIGIRDSFIRIECSARAYVPDGDGFIRTVDDIQYFTELASRTNSIPGDIAWGLNYILPFIN